MYAYKVCGLKINRESLQSEIEVARSVQLIKEKVAGGPHPQNHWLMLKSSLGFFSYILCHCFFLRVIKLLEKAEHTEPF